MKSYLNIVCHNRFQNEILVFIVTTTLSNNISKNKAQKYIMIKNELKKKLIVMYPII